MKYSLSYTINQLDGTSPEIIDTKPRQIGETMVEITSKILEHEDFASSIVIVLVCHRDNSDGEVLQG